MNEKGKYVGLTLFCLLMPFIVLAQAGYHKNVKIATAYYEVGEYSNALYYYQRALNKKDTVFLVRQMRQCYYYQRDFSSYLDFSKRLYRKNRKNETSIYAYAEALFLNGHYSIARRVLEKSTSLTKESQELLHKIIQTSEIEESGCTIRNCREVNTHYSEIAPAFYKNGFVFSSTREHILIKKKYGGDFQPFYDLYVYSQEGKKETVKTFSSKLNTPNHEAVCVITDSNSTIYFTRCENNVYTKNENKSDINQLKLFKSTKTSLGWSTPKRFILNDSLSSFGHPSISNDGRIFFFASDMAGGYGGIDIYVCIKINGHWSSPINLGEGVNTEKDEMYPFYHDSGKLYFTSNGQGGLGGYDIFEAKLNNGEYKDIKNMGKGINSSYDDCSLIMAPDSKSGYFSSNRPNGKGKEDIYQFILNSKE